MVSVGYDKHRTAEVGAAGAGPVVETQTPCPIIFLLGPPSAGKSALGSHACKELELEFLDLAATPATDSTTEGIQSDLDRLSSLVADHAADVIELPWPLQHERKALVLTRKSRVPLLLWAHPDDMQARSGREERLFTPCRGSRSEAASVGTVPAVASSATSTAPATRR